MARSTPVVRGDTLFYRRDGQDCQVQVDTPAWYDWLSENRTFAFRGDENSFTARRERAGNKRGGWYWKAYVKRDKRLLHAYLGKTESLTLERLHNVASELPRKQRNTNHYISLIEQAQLRGERQAEWFDRLDQEYDTIRATLKRLQEEQNVAASLRLCAALHLFWLVRDHGSEGLQWLERALANSEHAPLTLRAHASYTAGTLASQQGLHQRARELWEESLVMYQELNDQPGIVNALNKLGQSFASHAPSEAHTLYKMSLKLAQQCDYAYGELDATISLAAEALTSADLARAHMLYNNALDLSTSLGDTRSIAYSLAGLGHVLAQEGRYDEARELLEKSLDNLKEIGDQKGMNFLNAAIEQVIGDFAQ
jgi:tetratricopeptide (TPR) repeat protein